MSLRRLVVVVGVLLGLLVMHGLAPGYPTLHEPGDTSSMAATPTSGMPMPGHSAESSHSPSEPAPSHHDDSHMDSVCVAVLSSFALWLLLALGLTLVVLRRRPAQSSARRLVRQLRSIGIYRPPDLAQLCVLRI